MSNANSARHSGQYDEVSLNSSASEDETIMTELADDTNSVAQSLGNEKTPKRKKKKDKKKKENTDTTKKKKKSKRKDSEKAPVPKKALLEGGEESISSMPNMIEIEAETETRDESQRNSTRSRLSQKIIEEHLASPNGSGSKKKSDRAGKKEKLEGGVTSETSSRRASRKIDGKSGKSKRKSRTVGGKDDGASKRKSRTAETEAADIEGADRTHTVQETVKSPSPQISSDAGAESLDPMTASSHSTRSTNSKRRGRLLGGLFGKKESSTRKARSLDDNPDPHQAQLVPSTSQKTNKSAGSTLYGNMDSSDPNNLDRFHQLERENEALLNEVAVLRKELKQIDARSKNRARTARAQPDDAEYQALAAEHASLKRKYEELSGRLSDEEGLQKEVHMEIAHTSAQLKQSQSELQNTRQQLESMRDEIQEYDDAIAEKDNLIAKLTCALDNQLDKVDILELKLHRAEAEFVKMEDEMKELEDEVTSLRHEKPPAAAARASDKDEGPSNVSIGSQHNQKDSIHSRSSTGAGSEASGLRQVAMDMDRRLYEDKMKRLREREADLDRREKDLSNREHLVESDRENRLTEWENELIEMEKQLERERELLSHPVSTVESEDTNEESFRTMRGQSEKTAAREDIEAENHDLMNELEELRGMFMERGELVADLERQVVELKQVNSILSEEDFHKEARIMAERERQDEDQRAIQEGVNKQLQELNDENSALQAEISALRSRLTANAGNLRERGDVGSEAGQNTEEPREEKSAPDDDVKSLEIKQSAIEELQRDIAELNEKVLLKENEVSRFRDESQRIRIEYDEARKELEQAEREISTARSTEAADWFSKLKKRDETIAFMQKEIVRMTKEKQELEVRIRNRAMEEAEESVRRLQNDMMESHDEVELQRIHAINEQLRLFDEENRSLQQKLADSQESSREKIRERDEQIASLEEELADIRGEINRRKEADYVTLLKDRKERKVAHDKTKKELRQASSKIEELEDMVSSLKSEKDELDGSVDKMKKDIVARESGDYVSTLKRQIASLKDYNRALEKKIVFEQKEAEKNLKRKDDAIIFMQQQIVDLKKQSSAYMDSPRAQETRAVDGGKSIWSMLSPRAAGKPRFGVANAAMTRKSIATEDEAKLERPEERTSDADPNETLENDSSA